MATKSALLHRYIIKQPVIPPAQARVLVCLYGFPWGFRLRPLGYAETGTPQATICRPHKCGLKSTADFARLLKYEFLEVPNL